jgi:hypothetical protein
VDSKDVSVETQKQLGNLIATLAQQVTTTRSRSVIGALLNGIEEIVRPFNSLFSLVQNVTKAISSLSNFDA